MPIEPVPDQLAVAVLVVLTAVIVVARFEVICLRDLAATADADLRYLTRQAWVVVILLAVPVGGILYFYGGKAR
jgi:NADH:ubiquinone oxidoreductase subunit 6 (subunit J)